VKQGEAPTVAHVIHASPAATETFVHNQIRTLRRHRPVLVCHHRRAEAHFTVDPTVAVADVVSPPTARLDALAYRIARQTLPWAGAALARYVVQQDARLLHYHYLLDARFLLALKRRTGLPAVVSCYGYDVSSFPAKAWGLAGRYLIPAFRELDLFLAMSDDMRRDLERLGCPPAKIRVHYYGTDTTRFVRPVRDYAREPATVLVCGTLEPKKAQDLVLEALRRVEMRAGIPFRVVLVGEGPLRPTLERLIDEYGWRDRVAMVGHVPYESDALLDHYDQADIFALPSVTVRGDKEGIPGTIVEAMAAGLPVVGSWHAGIPAVIDDGATGLLVGERDVDALAHAFEQLLTDGDLRERLGRAAAQRAREELDLRPATVALESIYDDVMEAVPRRRRAGGPSSPA
jgi:colanic acid/amylovoran biosynthesis glycosyltransferase